MRKIKLLCITYITLLLIDSPLSFAVSSSGIGGKSLETGKEQTNIIMKLFSAESLTK
jgi:hypothetical protein